LIFALRHEGAQQRELDGQRLGSELEGAAQALLRAREITRSYGDFAQHRATRDVVRPLPQEILEMNLGRAEISGGHRRASVTEHLLGGRTAAGSQHDQQRVKQRTT
jgi:hypothetical protein